MALLDDLVSQIPDVALRGRLQKAIVQLRKRQKFGLVFEEHIPETMAIHGLSLQVGSVVQRRQDWEAKALYKVSRILPKGKKVEIVAEDGQEDTVAVSDLLTVKRSGEPMYAALRPLDRVTRGGEERPYHAVVNGENFHTLQLLTYLYANSVDCIYIDPPYNTGDPDWKYNNRFVDSNDAWRHSKWLAMMERRLRLAKRLLKPDGVVVVMIDEHELNHLGMLLERLFPEYLHYAVSIVINARGSTGNRNFGSIEEQALFVVPDLGYDLIQPREAFIPDFHPTDRGPSSAEQLLMKVAQAFPELLEQLKAEGTAVGDEDLDDWRELSASDLPLWEEDELEEEAEGEEEEGAEPAADDESAVYWRGAVRTGQGTSFRRQRPRQFYPLLIRPDAPNQIEVGEPLLDRNGNGELAPPRWEPTKGLTPIWPVDEEGAERVWCFEPGRMRAEIEKGNIRIGRFNPKRKTYAVNVRRVRRTAQRFRERTIWWEKAYDAGSNGTNILKRLLGESGLFPFPKSVYAVRDVLSTVVGARPNALILDFFAGSGTTLHSTCLLNAIDGGQRRCILVTNNEVDEKTAVELHKAGLFRGDPEFESMGIFERVAAPRVRAVLTGKRADGSPVPGKHKWASSRPFALGFEENAEFYQLEYLDPDAIELGEQFQTVAPLLWLAAGGVGEREDVPASSDFYVALTSPYGVLFRPSRIRRFVDALDKRPDVTHVWVVTDSDEAYAEACGALPKHIRHTSQLYRDYLRTFLVNGGRI
jgi:adenine-specific DNA-methyltransferase